MHPFMFPMQPSVTPNIADVSEELREKALKRTADTLRKIDEVRRTLELPVEHLPVVIDIYGKVVQALLAEEERKKMAERTKRLPITMRSEDRNYQPMKIPRGQVAEVTVRPQFATFRLEDVSIQGDQSRWAVHDIKVGNRMQIDGRRGPVPGNEFGPGGVCEHLRLETCQTAMDLALIVEYVGPEADGEVFEATLVGTTIEF